MLTAWLQPHPSTPCAFVKSLAVHVGRTGDRRLRFAYELMGSIERLRIPARRERQRADRLWQHTCFEAFLRPPDSSRYIELNFSPSGEWATYQFTGYREGMSQHAGIALTELATRCRKDEFTLDAEVRCGAAIDTAALSLCAVLEDEHGGISYWAVQHPSGNADFHHEAGFALTLPAANGTGPNP